MIKKVLAASLVVCVVLGGIAPFAQAEGAAKMGYVDFRRAFYENDKAKKKEEELKKYEEEKKKEQTKLIDEITEMKDKSELLSEEAKAKERKNIESKITELQDFEQSVRQELLSKKDEIYREIADDIQSSVDEVGKKGKYDYIFDSRSIINTGQDLDVTDEVIKILKKKK